MNKEKMLEVANLIEKAEPEKFHMSAWFAKLIPASEHGDYDYFDGWFEADDLVPQYVDNTVKAEDLLSAETLNLTCDTTACIAGWVIANEYFNGNTSAYDECTKNNLAFAYIDKVASAILGINTLQAKRLFYCDSDSIWVEVADDYDLSFDTEIPETWNIHPKHAADVLRRIANGELALKECNCSGCQSEE